MSWSRREGGREGFWRQAACVLEESVSLWVLHPKARALTVHTTPAVSGPECRHDIAVQVLVGGVCARIDTPDCGHDIAVLVCGVCARIDTPTAQWPS